MELPPEAPNKLAQLLEQVIALPPETHTLVLRHLPMPELARLSCVHKVLLVAWQQLRRQHPGKRYDPPTPRDLVFVKDRPRLERAGSFGDVAVIQAMVAAGVDERGVPLLEARSRRDDVRVVDEAMWAAVVRGRLHAVELLLDAGADVNAGFLSPLGAGSQPQARFPHAVLNRASFNGDLDVVKLLIQRGADVHGGHDRALVLASGNGQADVVELLIQYGADVHAGDDSALQLASMHGHAAAVQLLIQHGANVHAAEYSALQTASMNGHADVVQLLIQHGAVPQGEQVQGE
jgi:hypothetical protein